jgi:arylsulfatase A-like enzyme
MKPNILFLVIDSFRADKFLGKSKTSLTPNLDDLISKGVIFEQMISSSDQTGTSIASMFTGLFPCRRNLNEFTFSEDDETLLSNFKDLGYDIHGFLPDIDFFKTLSKQMDFCHLYNLLDKKLWKKIPEGLGKEMVENIPNSKNPWFYYVHVMDIRNPYVVSENFLGEEYGETNYDKIVSSLDEFFGEISNKVNFSDTIVVITSDHGDYIPLSSKFTKDQTKLEKIISEKTKSNSFLEKIGRKAIMNVRFASQTYQKEKLKHELTPYEMRSLNSRAQIDLYDELVRVPFLLIGPGIPQKLSIDQLVRHVDIFPTLLDFVGDNLEQKIDGVSFLNTLENKFNKKEIFAYIEVGINAGQLIGDKSFMPEVIGIRTQNFKYYRHRVDKKKYVHLYNLKKDPLEKENIQSSNSEKINEFEIILNELLENSIITKDTSLKDKEDAIELLKKLGYV